MNDEYITITGSNQTYKLISKSSLPAHKVQLVVEDDEGVRFVITKQSGCYKRVTNPVKDYLEDS